MSLDGLHNAPVSGSGNIDIKREFVSQKESRLNAAKGTPENEQTKFTGKSVEEKFTDMTLEKKLGTLGKMLSPSLTNLNSMKSVDSMIAGNKLRKDLTELAKNNRASLSDEEQKILDSSFVGRIARRDTKWGSNDNRAKIDMTSKKSPDAPNVSMSYMDKITNQAPTDLVKQQRAITNMSHEILNKLYENWSQNQ